MFGVTQIISLLTALSSVPSQIKWQIKTGFQRRDRKQVERVFNTVCDKRGCLKLRKEDFVSELEVLGAFVESYKSQCESESQSNDSTIGLEEFVTAVQAPRPMEQWTRSLPLAELLADCLPRCDKGDLLEEVSKLSTEELLVAAEAFKEELIEILMRETKRLKDLHTIDVNARAQESCLTSEKADKFVVESVSELRWGTIDDFHKGLSSRIGIYRAYNRFS